MTLGTADGQGTLLGAVGDLSSAEVALFPFEVGSVIRTEQDRRDLLTIVAGNADAGLRTVLCLDHDHARPVALGQPDSIVLRTSMTGSNRYVSEHSMPAYVEDPWDGLSPSWRDWRPLPRVGFMGKVDAARTHVLAGYDTGKPLPEGYWRDESRVREEVFPQPIDISWVLRNRVLTALRPSTLVEPSIVVRDRFHGHYSAADRSLMRTEYSAHLRESDYVLCVRGAGNYSIRLFETMAVGRVPVVLDTDLVLPCTDVIDWDAIAVRVPLVDIERVDEYVAAAHSQGAQAFARRQQAAREAWQRWLCPEGFADYVARVIVSHG